MATAIVVHSQFAAFTRGQVITDADTVKEILAGDHASSVHRITLPDAVATTAAEPTVAEAVAAGVAAAEAKLHATA